MTSLQILAVDADTNKLRVVDKNLKELHSRLEATGANALSVVSLAGSYRSGKSFLLTLMARYLESRRKNGAGSDNDTSWAHGANVDAFAWRPGVDRHTTGIWAAGPYIEQRDDRRVGILVVDSQGMWDGETDLNLLTSIFGLSSILSSVQIYNLAGGVVSMDKLDQVNAFTNFARSAITKCRRQQQQRGKQVNVPTFQSLHLLVRDYVGYEGDACDMQICTKQNRDFLKAQKKLPQFSKFYGDLESIYGLVDVMLLPPPGQDVCFSTNFSGEVSAIAPAFLKNATRYFDRLFGPALTLKALNGSALTPLAFVELTRTFAELFASSSRPSAIGFAKSLETSVLLCAREASLSSYRSGMIERIDNAGASSLSSDESAFLAADREARSNALSAFDRQATFGDAATIASERERLLASLELAMKDMRLLAADRARCSFNDWAQYVLLVIIAFIIDKTTDVTCDWWSSSCVSLSTALFKVYSAAFLIIIAVLSLSVYRYGGFSTAQACLALGERMAVVAREWSCTTTATIPIAAIANSIQHSGDGEGSM